jgi:hypothetical protein
MSNYSPKMLFLATGTGICVGGVTWLIKKYIFPENETSSETEVIEKDIDKMQNSQINVTNVPDVTNVPVPDVSNIPVPESVQDVSDVPDVTNVPDVSDVPVPESVPDVPDVPVPESVTNVPDVPVPDSVGNTPNINEQKGGSRRLFISKLKSRKRVNKCKYCKNG